MKVLLVCKDLWDVIDGSEPRPTSNTNLKAIQAYEKKVQQAQAKIILNIESDQHPHVWEGGPSDLGEPAESAHCMWICLVALDASAPSYNGEV